MIIPKEEMLEAYHYDLIEHARTARLIKEANKNKPGLHSQFLCKAGDGLIALGLRLRHMQVIFISIKEPLCNPYPTNARFAAAISW